MRTLKKLIPIFMLIVYAYWAILSLGAIYPDHFNNIIVQPISELRLLARLMVKPNPNKMWRFPETTSEKGVITYNKEKSWGDYTLYANTYTNKAVIIDMQGQIVHEWDMDFPTENLSYPDNIMTPRIFLDSENPENLYAFFLGEKLFYNKYGLKKFDRNSNTIWYNDHSINHDMIILKDGDLLAFDVRARKDSHPGLPQISYPIYQDYLVFINKEGKIYHEISLLDAFMDSPCESVLESLNRIQIDPLVPIGDLLHPNTIEPVPEKVAEAFPNITKNSVMLSLRNTDMIVFLDLDTEKITWALFGPWKRQHSVRFLQNGHIILLDNDGNNGPGGRSRILEVDLKDMSIVWEYTGSKEKPFFTRFNGMIDILPNGNLLITETHTGRIFEVTRDKEIVWDYIVHERIAHREGARIPSVVSAKRFSKNELGFLRKK